VYWNSVKQHQAVHSFQYAYVVGLRIRIWHSFKGGLGTIWIQQCMQQHINNTPNNNISNNSQDNITKHPPNHKPPPIVINNCENLNGLIRSTDKIVGPSKYFVKCHSNNSVSILAVDSDTYRAISKLLISNKIPIVTYGHSRPQTQHGVRHQLQ